MPKNLSYEEVRILEQTDMLLNHSSNINDFPKSISDAFRIYNTILKESGFATQGFAYSLEKSLLCYEKEERIPQSLPQLISNKADSFLLLPLPSIDHVFTCLVRKNKEGYSAVLTNLGEREHHAPYEEYLFSNMDSLKRALTFEKNRVQTGEIYDSFYKYAYAAYPLNINSQEQVVGNCFFKEIEKGMKTARLTPSEIRNSRISLGKLLGTPLKAKWPIPTKEIHRKYTEILKKEHPRMVPKIDETVSIYEKNKAFMRCLDTLNPHLSSHQQSQLITRLKLISPQNNINYKSLQFLIEKSKEMGFDIVSRIYPPRTAYVINHIYIFSENKPTTPNHYMNQLNFLKKAGQYLPLLSKEVIISASGSLQSLCNHEDYGTHLHDKTLELLPNNFYATYEKACCYYSIEDYKNALKTFQEASKLNPRSPDALFGMALCYDLMLDTNNSLETYQAVLHLQPRHIKALENSSFIYEKLSDDKNLIQIQIQLGKIYEEKEDMTQASTSFKRALQIDPKNPALFISLGRIYKNQGKYLESDQFYKGALSLYGQTQNLNPFHPKSKENLFDIYKNLGENSYKTKNFKKSENFYSLALKVNLKDVSVRIGYADALFAQNKISSSLSQLRLGLTFTPDSPEIHCKLGDYYLSTQEQRNAEKNYERAAHIYLNQKQPLKAVDAFFKAKELNPWNVDHRIGLGDCLSMLGRNDLAHLEYSGSIAGDPQNPEVHFKLGTLHLENNDFQKASDSFKKVLNIEPRNTAAENLLRHCHRKIPLPHRNHEI